MILCTFFEATEIINLICIVKNNGICCNLRNNKHLEVKLQTLRAIFILVKNSRFILATFVTEKLFSFQNAFLQNFQQFWKKFGYWQQSISRRISLGVLNNSWCLSSTAFIEITAWFNKIHVRYCLRIERTEI